MAARIWVIGALLLAAAPALGQGTGNVTMRLFTGAPTGSCTNRELAKNQATGDLYDCVDGAWRAIQGGGVGPQPNFPSVPSGQALPTGTQNNPYTGTLIVTGGSPPYTTTVTNGSLPAGLALAATNSTGVVISGTPTSPGTSTFTLNICDSVQACISFGAAIVITGGGGGGPSIPSGQTLPDATEGTLYNATLNVTGGAPPYAAALVTGTLPAGITLSGSSTGITFTGTPSGNGTFTFTLNVCDTTQTCAQFSGSLFVAAGITVNPPPVTNPISIPPGQTVANGQQGVIYTSTVTVTGGTPPYTSTIITGALPFGITLFAPNNIGAELNGNPTQNGTFNFAIQACDTLSACTSAPFTMVITPAMLQIVTTNCANGSVGNAYACTLSAGGGVQPYSWSVLSRSRNRITVRNLPSGLSLSSAGLITGTPTATGSFTSSIQVQDSAGTPQTAAATITISISSTSTCGFPSYNCSRSDWGAQIFNTMTLKPPDAGTKTCTAGMDGHLQGCGQLTGINTIVTNSLYNNVKMVRATDYNDTTEGCAFPIYQGPGGAAGFNVFSSDDKYFVINCGGGTSRVKYFDPVAFQVNTCAHLSNLAGCEAQGFVKTTAGAVYVPPATPRFIYTQPGTFQLMNGTQIQRSTITNGVVGDTVTVSADWIYAVPCWNMAMSDCPNWQASHTYQPGSNIFPTINNLSTPHSLQLINFTSCISGASAPNWATILNTPIPAAPSGQAAKWGNTWVITDGTCKWADMDIPQGQSGAKIAWASGLGGDLTDRTVAEVVGSCTTLAGSTCGQDRRGDCYIVFYDSNPNHYSHQNTCTGNAWNTVCNGGTGYNCAGGTWQRTYLGNVFRDNTLSHGFKAMVLHSLWINLGGTWTDYTFNNCALRDYTADAAIYCADTGNWNLNTYFWTVGTATLIDAYDWLQTGTIGHDMIGKNVLNFSAGAARTLRNMGAYVTRQWGNIGTTYDTYNWILDSTQPNTQTCTPNTCWAAGVNTSGCGSAACRLVTWDQHSSWVSNDGTDQTPICTWVYSNDKDAWPHKYPWLDELVCYSMDGLNHMARQAYPWNTQVNQNFYMDADIWSLARSGNFAGVTTDWWCTLGKTDGTNTSLCGAKFQANHAYAVGEYMGPWLGPNANSGRIYKVTTAGTTGTSASTAVADWCNVAGCTVTNGTVVFTYQGMATARSDVFIVKLQ